MLKKLLGEGILSLLTQNKSERLPKINSWDAQMLFASIKNPLLLKSIPITRILLLLMACLMFSCSTKKKVVNLNKLKKNPTSEGIIEHLKTTQNNYEGLEAKATVKFRDPYFSMSGTLNIKIRKDSLVWMSIRKFGLEAFRVQITHDSIQILDRLSNEYSVFPLDYIEKEYNLPADLSAIESVFYGIPLLLGSDQYQLDLKDENRYRLVNPSREQFVTEMLLDRNDLMVRESTYQDQRDENRLLKLNFDKYNSTELNTNFAFSRIIDVVTNQEDWLKLQVNFSKVDFQKPERIKFVVPPNYN